MSEQLTQPQQNKAELSDQEIASKFMQLADRYDSEIYGQTSTFDIGNGEQEYTLIETVNHQIRDENNAIIGRELAAQVADSKGERAIIPLTEYLRLTNKDENYLAQYEARAQADDEQASMQEKEKREKTEKHIAGVIVRNEVEQNIPADSNSYDFLFEKDDHTAEAEDGIDLKAEADKNPRLAKLFAPVETFEEAIANHYASQSKNYDYLYSNEDQYQSRLKIDNSKPLPSKNDYLTTTEQSLQEANEQIASTRLADKNLDKLFTEYMSAHPGSSLVDAVRKDAELRYTVGDYLLNTKLSKFTSKLPEQIKHNLQKSSPHNSYGARFSKSFDLRSPEMATLIALSMLDGTFIKPGKGDEIIYDKNGIAILGQHRYTANLLLS